MHIDDVIKYCIVALFSSTMLDDPELVLKGGTALRLVEKIKDRMSTDMDFSIDSPVNNPDSYFSKIQRVLSNHFKTLRYEVIDFKFEKKPKQRREDQPYFWGGWACQFKLVDVKHKNLTLESKRRNALMPTGSNSTKIELEVSENEYCGSVHKVKIDDVSVTTYTNVALVLEKIRSLCQAHPDYPHSKTKDRARDYLDIFALVEKYKSEKFYDKLKKELPPVFKAKEVDFRLLNKIFEPDFSNLQKQNFIGVQDRVQKKTQPFEFYEEYLKGLIQKIKL
ncbi:MAG: nucleotidyl transferase AbiEii/AbiGii toxin family protein [Deltaproteobacteria bacterium]|nr:nucleotidyl transferase AbiEii/AbiGii toxin family protein [Deltaproteobacteria bacterium]